MSHGDDDSDGDVHDDENDYNDDDADEDDDDDNNDYATTAMTATITQTIQICSRHSSSTFACSHSRAQRGRTRHSNQSATSCINDS